MPSSSSPATGFSTAGAVRAVIETPSGRTWVRAYLSSAALGTTNADVIDCGGLALSGIYISSNASTACTYRIYGGLDSTNVQQCLTSTGAIVRLGSTLSTNLVGRLTIFDPAPYAGLRYIQFVSETTSDFAPNSSGDANGNAYITAYLAPWGQRK